jgi:drug/metabolite transporter (DMT)-like permease
MNWFLIALVNPLAHAVVNHLDKFIISRFMKGQAVGALVLLTSIVSAVVLPIVLIINPGVFTSMTFQQSVVLALNGCLMVVAAIFYFTALEAEEASYVVPFFQLVPVFGFFLGYLILGETLTRGQIYGSALIVFGGILLSFRLLNGRLHIPKKIIFLMLGSSFFYALNAIIFKSVAIHQGFVDSLFWDMAGKLIFGIILFIILAPYRRALITVIKVNSWPIIALGFFTESLGVVGEMALILAVLYAPVALVQAVGGLQPLFVLVLGVFITIFLSKYGRESLARGALLQKTIGIVIMMAGSYLLAVN